jgi:ParB family chromosome partitioning protein
MNAMMKHKGLGRGLDALLGGRDDINAPADAQRSLPVTSLQPGKYQPRTRMDAASLDELAASIRAQGIMQPILVRPVGGDRFEIIAGERRWRASQLAGLSDVPVLVREIPDDAALAMALIENIQREDLNPLEEAFGLQRLVDEFGMTHQQAADAVGRSRPAASNLLRLLQLTAPVQDMLLEGELEMGHARALLSLPGAEQVQLANRAVAHRLSVRQVEESVQRLSSPKKEKPLRRVDRDLQRLEEELSELLGANIVIQAGARGRGKVMIDYSSLDELDGIVQRFRS